jgi:hypothetical protein
MGLFIGSIGFERVYCVRDQNKKGKIISDYNGVTFLTYDGDRSDKDLSKALSPTCTQIKRIIERIGIIEIDDSDDISNKESVGNSNEVKTLDGSKEIFEDLISALTKLDLEKVVVHRVLPMEFTPDVFGPYKELADTYESIMQKIIPLGEDDIGFWDKTIYGCAFNSRVRRNTVKFIRKYYIPCPDTSYIGIDETCNHIGFFMLGESITGFPSDFAWKYGIVFFGDPSSSRPTPVSGFSSQNHEFIETVFHSWWKVLQKNCEKNNQYWDSRDYMDNPDKWEEIIDKIDHTMTNYLQ